MLLLMLCLRPACCALQPTPEVAVFDLLGIPLVHGWLVDPQDSKTTAVFGNKSYNELVELLFMVRHAEWHSARGIGQPYGALRSQAREQMQVACILAQACIINFLGM